MADTMLNQYIPDYLVPPGEVLEEYLEAYSMTQAELSARTGLTKKTINEIIKGKSPITSETALKLERSLGRPAHFWNNLEGQFQEDRSRFAEKIKIAPGIVVGRLQYDKRLPNSHGNKLKVFFRWSD